jgi:hypothetical protein
VTSIYFGSTKGKENPTFLSVNEYSVKSEVSISAFSKFVSFIEGSPIEITAENFESFERLSEEFEFRSLRNSCASFSELKNYKMNNFICDRLCDLEERYVFQDRSIISATQQIHILQKEFARYLKEQRELFESEILYRRGCEYLYARNGSSDNAAFGFSQLKRSAELGHSEAAFECGQ